MKKSVTIIIGSCMALLLMVIGILAFNGILLSNFAIGTIFLYFVLETVAATTHLYKESKTIVEKFLVIRKKDGTAIKIPKSEIASIDIVRKNNNEKENGDINE